MNFYEMSRIIFMGMGIISPERRGNDIMVLPFVKTSCKNSTSVKEEALLREIQAAQRDMDQALQNFENASDPSLIDSCIFDLNAAQMRHKYLMQKAKSMSLSAH